ncbi:MAG: NifB/NifX family molybdenum-iron cluster-binding protein [Campylobacterota bacterium]|nr:NifB/NifX family molybdenum-iron cluster-binding protein [Campylobacterota bacterium]
MKVAFPTNKGEKIARHASFCNSFLIIDTKTDEREIVDNPLKTEAATVGAKRDKSEGRHLGSGPVVSALLADAGVDLYVYLEAEANFLLHLQREGVDIYETREKVIETVLETIKIIETKENEMDQMQESEFAGLGRGMGLGRGFGNRAGMGQRIGRAGGIGRGFGRGFGRGAGMGQRAGGFGRGVGRGFGNR